MDNIKFNSTGGFPLDTDVLGAMQGAYSLFNQLGNLAGNKAIISGCDATGTSISDGIIFLNGEILPFKGGAKGTSIIIKETTENRVFEDGATKPVIVKRYATFGSSTPEKTFAWAEFKRFDDLLENTEKNIDFEKRLKALEIKKSPVPLGLIAIWGKPASEPIPEGWQECTDLRGRFPLGWNPDDEDFNTIGNEGGEKQHTLTVEEMPRHNHTGKTLTPAEAVGIHPDGHDGAGFRPGSANNAPGNTGNAGGNQPHNNMPPYRIIKYIEFVGFS